MIITPPGIRSRYTRKFPILLEGKDLKLLSMPGISWIFLRLSKIRKSALDFTTSVSPCVVRPLKGSNFTYLLLPVRIYVSGSIMEKVRIHTRFIKLNQLLKWVNAAESGAEANHMIAEGMVRSMESRS